MRLSIVIPVHNSENFLDECLQGILKQISSEDEIILIENGSTDNTPKLCKKYKVDNDNIKYIELGAVGVSVARNEGIQAAEGEWITFVDSDDCLLEGAVRVLEENIATDADVIIAGYSNNAHNSEELINAEYISPELLAKGVLQFGKYKEFIVPMAPIDDYNNWAVWGKFYKRKFIINNNIEFPAGVRLSEDTAFLFQVYCAATKIIATKKMIYFYRENENSVSRVYNDKLMDNNLLFIEFMEKYRNKFFQTQELSTEFAALYATKIIDICWNIEKSNKEKFLKKELMRSILRNKTIISAIKNAPIINLINGKKNNLNYGKKLICLKLQLLCKLI